MRMTTPTPASHTWKAVLGCAIFNRRMYAISKPITTRTGLCSASYLHSYFLAFILCCSETDGLRNTKKITRHKKKMPNQIELKYISMHGEIVNALEFIDEDPDVFMQHVCSQGNFLDSVEIEGQDLRAEEKSLPITEKDVALQRSVEEILLSMFDADERSLLRKDFVRVKNRMSAQQTRDADKMFVEKMLFEFKEALETFQLYKTYISKLRMYASTAESILTFEKRHSTHKENVALLKIHECIENAEDDTPKNPQESVKERNRRHARKSRMKKIKYIENLVKERDEMCVTLEEVVKYTTALEGSCSFLNDLSEEMNAILMDMRQKLFARTCVHHDKFKQLKSHATFRVAYRLNFR